MPNPSTPANPPSTPSHPDGHFGIVGWHGEGIEAGEKLVAHWHVHHGQLVLTDRRLLLLSHPHVTTLKREVAWTTPLEEIHDLEVRQASSIDSARHTASISTGSMPEGRAGGSSAGAIGVQEATLAGSFEVDVDSMIVFKGNPRPAEEIRDRIDEARTARLLALGRLSKGPA